MRSIKLIIVIVFVMLTNNISAQSHVKEKQKIKVFLLAGQSNMDGRGDGSKLTEEDFLLLKEAQENVSFAYNRKPVEPLYVTTPANHIQKKFQLEKTFGPELFFGTGLSQAYPNEKILLIKRSLGGTSLYGCWNPDWSEEKATLMNELERPKLYSDFVSYIKEVLSEYEEDEYEICAMLWVQGETDSGVKKFGPKPSETYEKNLKNLIARIRQDVEVEDLPFMMLQVGGGKVVEGMKNIAKSVKNVSLITQDKNKNSARFLPTYGPPIGHYTYDGMKTIGLWFKECYISEYATSYSKKKRVSEIEDSSWREDANQRIDKYRKSNLKIKVVGENKEPISDVKVDVKLIRHKFWFGAVVQGGNFMTSPYTKIYRENFIKYFNSGGFNIGLKPKQRGRETESDSEKAMPWFIKNNIDMRGHTLVWEGDKFFRPEQKRVLKNKSLTDKEKGEKLLEMASIHIPHAVKKWDVIGWDVVNEPFRNDAINELLEINTFSYWFKLADSLRKEYNRTDVKLFLNENKIISNPFTGDPNKPKIFKAILDEMLADGAPVEGLGFQSRIKNGYLPPDTLYKRLCEFDKYNIPYQATEFEIRDTKAYKYSDKEKRQMLDELLTVYFSHPKVEGIWHWTFANNKKGMHPWALFNYDGTPSVFGKQWIKIMEENFNTDIYLITDKNGLCHVRGFKGEYEIIIKQGVKKVRKMITLDGDKEEVIELK